MLRRAIPLGLTLTSALAWAGSYGTYKEPRAGYTIAQDISVGYMSDHAREGEYFSEKERAAKRQIAALAPQLDAWVARARGVSAYRGWLGAWDAARTTGADGDYHLRIPAPHAKPLDGDPPGGGARDLELYLHARATATHLMRGRALVGFALAEAQLGDGELRLPTESGLDTVAQIAQRLASVDRGDGYAGQPALVATALLALSRKQAELAKLVGDASQAWTIRLLARELLHGYRRDPWTEADWSLVPATAKNDPRQVWTWVLLFTDERDLGAMRGELERRFPLSDEHRRFFLVEWVDGTKD